MCLKGWVQIGSTKEKAKMSERFGTERYCSTARRKLRCLKGWVQKATVVQQGESKDV